MTNDDFKAWRKRMGYTLDAAAAALEVNRNTIKGMEADRKPGIGNENTSWPIDKRTSLACAALEAGIVPAWEKRK